MHFHNSALLDISITAIVVYILLLINSEAVQFVTFFLVAVVFENFFKVIGNIIAFPFRLIWWIITSPIRLFNWTLRGTGFSLGWYDVKYFYRRGDASVRIAKILTTAFLFSLVGAALWYPVATFFRQFVK
jgi:hypothetical protein